MTGVVLIFDALSYHYLVEKVAGIPNKEGDFKSHREPRQNLVNRPYFITSRFFKFPLNSSSSSWPIPNVKVELESLWLVKRLARRSGSMNQDKLEHHEEMRAKYDLSRGVRGKYYQQYRRCIIVI